MKKLQILFIALVLLVPVLTAHALTRSEVEKNLTCYACPGEALNIDRCSGGNQMRAEIDRRMALGDNKQTILNYFTEKFGEDILTVPPQKGFNLVAYAAPFVALFIGFILAGMLIWKWVASGRSITVSQEQDAESKALYETMKDQVENELKKLEDD